MLHFSIWFGITESGRNTVYRSINFLFLHFSMYFSISPYDWHYRKRTKHGVPLTVYRSNKAIIIYIYCGGRIFFVILRRYFVFLWLWREKYVCLQRWPGCYCGLCPLWRRMWSIWLRSSSRRESSIIRKRKSGNTRGTNLVWLIFIPHGAVHASGSPR